MKRWPHGLLIDIWKWNRDKNPNDQAFISFRSSSIWDFHYARNYLVQLKMCPQNVYRIFQFTSYWDDIANLSSGRQITLLPFLDVPVAQWSYRGYSNYFLPIFFPIPSICCQLLMYFFMKPFQCCLYLKEKIKLSSWGSSVALVTNKETLSHR